MKRKILSVSLVIIILSIFIFWDRYKLDIDLFADKLKFGDEYGIEKMVHVKAHDFISRLCYSNSMSPIDNYFDKNCEVYIDNERYIYSEDIRSKMIEYLRRKRREPDTIIIRQKSSRASIVDFNDNEVNSKVNGKFKVLSVEEYFNGEYDKAEEVSFEYTVTFKKKFLFIWKAAEFKTDNSVIKDIMTGDF